MSAVSTLCIPTIRHTLSVGVILIAMCSLSSAQHPIDQIISISPAQRHDMPVELLEVYGAAYEARQEGDVELALELFTTLSKNEDVKDSTKINVLAHKGILSEMMNLYPDAMDAMKEIREYAQSNTGFELQAMYADIEIARAMIDSGGGIVEGFNPLPTEIISHYESMKTRHAVLNKDILKSQLKMLRHYMILIQSDPSLIGKARSEFESLHAELISLRDDPIKAKQAGIYDDEDFLQKMQSTLSFVESRIEKTDRNLQDLKNNIVNDAVLDTFASLERDARTEKVVNDESGGGNDLGSTEERSDTTDLNVDVPNGSNFDTVAVVSGVMLVFIGIIMVVRLRGSR